MLDCLPKSSTLEKCTILRSHKQCYQGSNFPHLLQHLLLRVFVITTLLEGDEVVSPCIFLKANINKAFLDHSILFFLIIIILIIFYFWLHWFLVAVCGLFFNCGEWGYSLTVIHGLPTAVAFPVCGAHTLGPTDFSSCSTWAQQLWPMGLVAPWHVASSQSRDWTHVPCISRRILNHWTSREVLINLL